MLNSTEPNKIDPIAFLRSSWLEGNYKMLFNTQSNIDHQRRAFSHDEARLDILPGGPKIGRGDRRGSMPDISSSSGHVQSFLEQIEKYTKENGALTLPVTPEKMEQFYKLISEVAKDLTEHPDWNQFWVDWAVQFKSEILKEPNKYFNKEQLNKYQTLSTEEDKNSFLDNFLSDQEKHIKSRVVGAYGFKLLTELVVHEKLTASSGKAFQQIANHYDDKTPSQMLVDLEKGFEERVRTQIEQESYGAIYMAITQDETNLGNRHITAAAINEASIKAKKQLREGEEYQKLMASNPIKISALILGSFDTNNAQENIGKYIQARINAKKFLSDIKTKKTADNELGKKLVNYVSDGSFAYLNVSISTEDYTNKSKLQTKIQEIEIKRIENKINSSMEKLIHETQSETKKPEEIKQYLTTALANFSKDTEQGKIEKEKIIKEKSSLLIANLPELYAARDAMLKENPPNEASIRNYHASLEATKNGQRLSLDLVQKIAFQSSPEINEIVSSLNSEIERQQVDIQDMRGARFTSKPAKLEALKAYRDAILLASDATALAGAMATLPSKQQELLNGSRSPRTEATLEAVAKGIKSVESSPASSPVSSSTSTPESTPPVSPRFETIQRSEGLKKANFTIGTHTPSPNSSPPLSPRGDRKNSISIGSTRSSPDSSPSSSTPGTPQEGNAKAPSHADIQKAVTSAFTKSKTASKSEDKPKPDSDTPSTPSRRPAPKRP